MKLNLDMEKPYGDYSIMRYKVRVEREVNEVRVIIQNEESGMIHNGGEIRLPVAEANRLGHALVMDSVRKYIFCLKKLTKLNFL